jgi:hypothetical protein
MDAYLLHFAVVFFLHFWPNSLTVHRHDEMVAITHDILSTDATVDEALQLENIVGMETGWYRDRTGAAGEVGAFQIMPWPTTTSAERAEWRVHGAKEALRRLRAQGIAGYCGCRYPDVKPCPELMEHRTWPARLYRLAFDPPVEPVQFVLDTRDPTAEN